MPNSFPQAIETEAVIIGAGPVGLFQVFELGLLEIKAHVIDSLKVPGGQCVELYPDKPIYDIPAIPLCTGQELTDQLLQQIRPFAPQFHLGQVVNTLSQQADGRFLLSTSLGKNFLTKTIFIAAGVGSFQPRTLKIAGIERFYQQQIFFEDTNPSRYINKHIVVLGDDDCALDSCLNLVDEVQSLTLIHRRHELKAKPDSIAKIRALCDSSSMRFMVGQVTGFEEANQLLSALIITGQDGLTRRIPLDILLAFLGLSPKLGPIADWGLQLDRKQILVDTEKFSTNTPGIFAVGDINTYPGKKKLILCGFHEATLAAFAAKEYLYPEKKVPLQYTTTSPKIHQLLGVNTPRND